MVIGNEDAPPLPRQAHAMQSRGWPQRESVEVEVEGARKAEPRVAAKRVESLPHPRQEHLHGTKTYESNARALRITP